MSDNARAREFLVEIRNKNFDELYPFPHDTDVDDRFAIALGQIAGIAVEALDAVATDRKIRVDLTYLRLDEKDFKDLVAGAVVEKGQARLILADIGFAQMMLAIKKALER